MTCDQEVLRSRDIVADIFDISACRSLVTVALPYRQSRIFDSAIQQHP